jgi:hypothetical protein
VAETDGSSEFVGWGSDACSDDADTCTVEGDADVVLFPRFLPVVELVVRLTGDPEESQVAIELGDSTPSALVAIDPEPCRDVCEYDLPAGTLVTLSATANGPWRFEAWGETDACDDTESICEISVVRDSTVVVIFEFDDSDGEGDTGTGAGVD